MFGSLLEKFTKRVERFFDEMPPPIGKGDDDYDVDPDYADYLKKQSGSQPKNAKPASVSEELAPKL